MWVGLQPGSLFDAMKPCPLLEAYIKEGKVPAGKALVPGCGRGYDVIALAAETREALGIDIVEAAITAAKEFKDEYASKLDSEAKLILNANANFQVASFFNLDDKFDFIYDYTFFCALDPSVRQEWAEKMYSLIKPGGELLTLIFPMVKDESYKRGPPFKVTLALYKDLLVLAGFECLELRELPPELSHEGRDGITARTQGLLASSGVGRWKKLNTSM